MYLLLILHGVRWVTFHLSTAQIRPRHPGSPKGYPGPMAGSFILRRLERTPSAMGPGSPLRFGRDDGPEGQSFRSMLATAPTVVSIS